MTQYEQWVYKELRKWQKQMTRRPSITSRITGSMQRRLNNIIPDKVHKAITTTFRHMISGMLKGTEFVSGKPLLNADLQTREDKVTGRIKLYKNTAAAEGAVTGAAGFLASLADFPLWLSIKMKMLSDIASLYGYDVRDYKERLYMLNIFQLAFSRANHRRDVYLRMIDHEGAMHDISNEDPDWRKLQQEYRDYIDLAKLLQLIPGIGAVVGLYVNHKLTNKLGKTAMNAYRMRWFNEQFSNRRY